MYGADVAQLRSLAAQFASSADRIDSDRMAVGNAIQIKAWFGPNATRFRAQWESEHSRRLVAASRRLRDAAVALRRNADEQERASSTNAGSPGGRPFGVPPLPAQSGAVPGSFLRWVEDVLTSSASGVDAARTSLSAIGIDVSDVWNGVTGLSGAIDLVGTYGELLSARLATPPAFGAIGVLSDLADQWEAANEGDYIGTMLSGASGGAGIAGMVVSKAGPLGAGISVAKTFVDWTLPYNAEPQDVTMDKGAEHLFGRGATRADLTPEQTHTLNTRYTGPWGVAYMISDRMDATADEIFPWNSNR